ncbi:MAG: hypothetical protein AUK47_05555 [Deltaproteobacteria bacterium CG2_30_63_29]|nr:MAG: hypothetical protein AUK47_05555 [Deltaproteobacteria bacterium CG2_30_63_29]
MSTIHHSCSVCFGSERRGFTFTGAIPMGEAPRCVRCGAQMNRILRLAPEELSDAAEVAYDGAELVVREPLWDQLRHRVLSAIAPMQLGQTGRTDGLIEVPVRDTLSLLLQPVVDHISGQEGCLIAARLFDADEEDPANVRDLLKQMNESLGEQTLMLGTLRDLFPLAEPRSTVFYRRFVDVEQLNPKAMAEFVNRAHRVSLFVNEALSTFGFSPASLRFLANLRMGEHAPKLDAVSGADWTPAESLGNRSLDDLLTSTDEARARRIDRDEAREHILEFLRALDIDLSQVSDDAKPDQLAFHYRDVNLKLDFLDDERDSYLRVSAHIAASLQVDEQFERMLTTLSRGLLMGDVVLRPDALSSDQPSKDRRYDVILQDTILGDDLNVDELAKVLSNIAHHAGTFRESLSTSGGQEPGRGAALDGLISFISMRAMLQSRSPNLPKLTQRVCEHLAQLGVYPRLTNDGDLGLVYNNLRVSIHLGEVVPDSFLTVRAHILPGIGVERHEALRFIADLEVFPIIGGFRVLDDGSVTFEDTVLGNSLDLNELAKTLHEVVMVATTHRRVLHESLGSTTPLDHDPKGYSTEGLASLYRRSYDSLERQRAIRALAMFPDPHSVECLFEALRDPDIKVAEIATAGLEAEFADGHVGLIEDVAQMASDTHLSDLARRRAIRVLSRGHGQSVKVAACLKNIALSDGETLELRAFTFEALGALGSPDVVKVLVEGVKHSSHLVSHAALEAMVSLGLSEPAPLFLAAEEALNRLRGHDDKDRATIFKTIARLGMQETVLDLIDNDWERSAEVASGLAEACATSKPPKFDLLREMLKQERGEIRRVAYEAIDEHGLDPMADDLAEALIEERDEALKPTLIHALGKLGQFSRKVADSLQSISRDSRLRIVAMDTLHQLRVAQMRSLKAPKP